MVGNGTSAAWIGAGNSTAQTSTDSPIVAGVTTPAGTARGQRLAPRDASVLKVAPARSPGGVSSTFLLRGIYDRSGESLAWLELEILRVDASWRSSTSAKSHNLQ